MVVKNANRYTIAVKKILASLFPGAPDAATSIMFAIKTKGYANNGIPPITKNIMLMVLFFISIPPIQKLSATEYMQSVNMGLYRAQLIEIKI